MARDLGIVGCFAVAVALGASATASAQPSTRTGPASTDRADGPANTPAIGAVSDGRGGSAAPFVNPRRMLLDGPADDVAPPMQPRARRVADFPSPRSHRDADFFPVAMLLAFPFAFALVRIGENLAVARRHQSLEPETDVARRVSLVVDRAGRRAIRARIKEIPKSPRADPYRTVEECTLLSVLSAVKAAAEHATYATLETTLESRRGAASTVARWAEELGLAFRAQSLEMSASLVDEPLESDEAAKFFVLSILVHARTELPFPPESLSRATFADVLDSLVGDRGFLARYQLVWTPADEEDGIPAAEIASQHPDLVPLDAGPAVPQKSCRFCGARHAAEHVVCPTCGAPEALEDERTSLDELIHVEDVECKQCGAMFPSNRYRCLACGAHRFTESGLAPPVERASLPPAARASTPPPPLGGPSSVPPASGESASEPAPPPASRSGDA